MKQVVDKKGKGVMSLRSFVGNVIIELLSPSNPGDEVKGRFEWVSVLDLFKEVRQVVGDYSMLSFEHVLNKLFILSIIEYNDLQNPFEARKVKLTSDGLGFRGLFKDYRSKIVLETLRGLFPHGEELSSKRVSDCFVYDGRSYHSVSSSLRVGSGVVDRVCRFYGLVSRSFHTITLRKRKRSCICFHLTHKGLFFLNVYPLLFKK